MLLAAVTCAASILFIGSQHRRVFAGVPPRDALGETDIHNNLHEEFDDSLLNENTNPFVDVVETVRDSQDESEAEISYQNGEKSLSTDTVAWTEDGRIRCVEKNEDVIECNTYEKNDHPHKKKRKEISDMISGKRVKKQLKGSEKLTNGKKITQEENHNGKLKSVCVENVDEKTPESMSAHIGGMDTQRTKFAKQVDRQRVVTPRNKPSSRESTAKSGKIALNPVNYKKNIKLDLSEGVIKVVNPYTGEKKDFETLDSDNDIDIDSLTYPPLTKQGVGDKDRSSGETLQALLDKLSRQNTTTLHFDKDNHTSLVTWPNDHKCKKFVSRISTSSPVSVLWSYPHSGRNFLRHLVEGATGVFLAPQFNQHLGLFDETAINGSSEKDFTVLRDPNNETLHRPEQQGSSPVVLLLRNPERSLISKWMAKNAERKFLPSSFKTKEFHEFVREELQDWEQMYIKNLLWSRHVHVIHSDSLVQRPLQELVKLLSFLDLPPPSSRRLHCLKRNIPSSPGEKEIKYAPFTTVEEDALWSSVSRVSAMLKLRGFDLPIYYAPLERYPPDRITRIFHSSTEDGAQENSGREEL